MKCTSCFRLNKVNLRGKEVPEGSMAEESAGKGWVQLSIMTFSLQQEKNKNKWFLTLGPQMLDYSSQKSQQAFPMARHALGFSLPCSLKDSKILVDVGNSRRQREKRMALPTVKCNHQASLGCPASCSNAQKSQNKRLCCLND